MIRGGWDERGDLPNGVLIHTRDCPIVAGCMCTEWYRFVDHHMLSMEGFAFYDAQRPPTRIGEPPAVRVRSATRETWINERRTVIYVWRDRDKAADELKPFALDAVVEFCRAADINAGPEPPDCPPWYDLVRAIALLDARIIELEAR